MGRGKGGKERGERNFVLENRGKEQAKYEKKTRHYAVRVKSHHYNRTRVTESICPLHFNS